jgi:hypothetical protein
MRFPLVFNHLPSILGRIPCRQRSTLMLLGRMQALSDRKLRDDGNGSMRGVCAVSDTRHTWQCIQEKSNAWRTSLPSSGNICPQHSCKTQKVSDTLGGIRGQRCLTPNRMCLALNRNTGRHVEVSRSFFMHDRSGNRPEMENGEASPPPHKGTWPVIPRNHIPHRRRNFNYECRRNVFKHQ